MQKQLLHDEIPIAVVWDKNLTDKDKLVFGEIFTMINQGKPFIMSNKHIAIRLNCSSRTISKSVNHLIKTDWVKAKNIKSKTGSTEYRQIYGINLLRALKFSSMVHRNISLGVHDKNFHQIDQSNTSENTSVTDNSGNPNYRKMIIKDLEALMVNINTFVAQDIDDWLKTYDPKLIMKAIHQVGVTNPNPRWVVTNITNQLERGCQTYQSKRHVSYGRQPVKERLPKWAKNGYKPKLHPTGKKLQEKVRKSLAKLNHGGGKK